MLGKSFLLEGRVEDFKERYKNKFTVEELDRIISMIPSKYLEWAGKNIDRINFTDNLVLTKKLLDNFEKISSNLTKTDINGYQSIKELNDSLTEYNNRSRRNYKQVKGGNVVYEDGNFFIVNPLSHEASCYYGKGTKWCTAASSDENFKRYNDDGKLFYVLNTSLPSYDPNYKIAILKKFDGETTYWDAKDNFIKDGSVFFGSEKLNEINSVINSYMEEFFSEQLKIYRDKEARKKEQERIERLRIQRELDTKRAQANGRRSDDEWNLNNPDIDETGLKANALFKWLIEDDEIDPKTNEDKERIAEIDNQIEILNSQYDQAEDPRPELLDEISELEDEKEELEKKIDVYHIIPKGTFYDMDEFEVIDSDVSDRTYVVGTQKELEESAHDYVENLIDDIGYDGFANGFAENYIDEDAVADAAYDSYYYDVHDNPDSYFSDSERKLSDSQIDRINYLKSKKVELTSIIEKLEGFIEDTDDQETIEEYEEKIQEMEDLINENDEEIEDIEEDPQGDFPDELFEEKINELTEDVRRDPMWYINDTGMDINDYIDKDKFIEGVLDSDGYGIVNGYDGSYDEVSIGGQYFVVMRTD